MAVTEKENLNANSKSRYVLRTILMGFQNTIDNPIKLFWIFAALAGLLGGVASWAAIVPDYLATLVWLLSIPLFILAVMLVLFLLGYAKGAIKYYRNFLRAGFYNSAQEAPFLFKHEKKGKVEILTFYSLGLPYSEWDNNLDVVQSAINMTIDRVSRGQGHSIVIVEAVPPDEEFEEKTPWDDSFVDPDEAIYILGMRITGQLYSVNLDRQPHLAIAGSTGSGKTVLVRTIIRQAILHKADVYICDYKRVDFCDMKDTGTVLVHERQDILDVLKSVTIEMMKRLDEFSDVGASNYQEYMESTPASKIKRMIIVVDELSMLTDFGDDKEDKKLSSDIMYQLAQIARLGRCVGIHLVLAQQRPDSNTMSGPVKSNIDIRICGKADTTLSTIILGDGRADSLIPKDSQGLFVLADGCQDVIFKGFYLPKVKSSEGG